MSLGWGTDNVRSSRISSFFIRVSQICFYVILCVLPFQTNLTHAACFFGTMFGTFRYNSGTKEVEHVELERADGFEARGYSRTACNECRTRKVNTSSRLLTPNANQAYIHSWNVVVTRMAAKDAALYLQLVSINRMRTSLQTSVAGSPHSPSLIRPPCHHQTIVSK